MVDGDGRNQYPRDDVWLTDGYGDYVRHYLRAMEASPDLAPDDQNHLLGTTSVIQSIEYTPDRITYTKFDRGLDRPPEARRLDAWPGHRRAAALGPRARGWPKSPPARRASPSSARGERRVSGPGRALGNLSLTSRLIRISSHAAKRLPTWSPCPIQASVSLAAIRPSPFRSPHARCPAILLTAAALVATRVRAGAAHAGPKPDRVQVSPAIDRRRGRTDPAVLGRWLRRATASRWTAKPTAWFAAPFDVGAADETGLVTVFAPGELRVGAIVNGKTGWATVRIRPQQVARVDIAPLARAAGHGRERPARGPRPSRRPASRGTVCRWPGDRSRRAWRPSMRQASSPASPPAGV